MGKFQGRPWRDENGKEYAFCIAWGRLTRDPKVTCFQKEKVEFGIAYHRKQFINCEAWGGSPSFAVMSSLEKGDEVLVLGVYHERPYTTKDGTEKVDSAIICDICLPMALLDYVLKLMGSSSLKMLVDADANAPADPMESAEPEEFDYEPRI